MAEEKTANKKKYKVVFVDDEKKVLIVVRKIFTAAGYDVKVCEGASDATEIVVNQGPVAVLVADNRMPEMRGTELLEHVRKISPNTVRILTTAFYDKQLIEDIVNKGEAYRFLKKPIDFKMALRLLDQSVSQYDRNVEIEKQAGTIKTLTGQKDNLEEEKTRLLSKVKKFKGLSILIAVAFTLLILAGVTVKMYMDYSRDKHLVDTSKPLGDWVIYENGTSLDTVHHLMWMNEDFRNIEKRNPKDWHEINKWVDKMNLKNFAGYDDWRVPTIKEYQQTFDPDRTKLAYDNNKDYPVGYPKAFSDGGGYGFWSIERVGESSARYFFFIGGYEKSVNTSYNSPTMSVRLVRSVD